VTDSEIRRLLRVNAADRRSLKHCFRVIRASINAIRLLEPRIANQERERKSFLDSPSHYKPELEFRTLEFDIDNFLSLLGETESAARRMDVDGFGDEGAEILKEMLAESFEELRLHARLADNLDEPDRWRRLSAQIWGEPDRQVFLDAVNDLQDLEPSDRDEPLDAYDLAGMFRNHLYDLGVDYTVEVRRVPGNFNLPGDRTLVAAAGENGERRYSRAEARQLVVHECFHVVRAHNGYATADRIDMPPFTGVFTPYYDRTEEGGAALREEEAGVLDDNKRFDYRIRTAAAYLVHDSDDFREEFPDMVERLVDLGATEGRAFDLLVRNRQALRHHIYWGGTRCWQDVDRDLLLHGKLNSAYASRLEPLLPQKPDVGAEDLFSSYP
jgi:hypothetical protein